MADRPDFYPDWATNDTTLPVAGGDNKERPDVSRRNTGVDLNDPAECEEINWQFDNLAKWARYFDSKVPAYDIEYYTHTTGSRITLIVTPKSSITGGFPGGTIIKSNSAGWTAGNNAAGRLGSPGAGDWLYVWALNVSGALEAVTAPLATTEATVLSTTGASKAVKVGMILWDSSTFQRDFHLVNGISLVAIADSQVSTTVSASGQSFATIPVFALSSVDGTPWLYKWTGSITYSTDASFTGTLQILALNTINSNEQITQSYFSASTISASSKEAMYFESTYRDVSTPRIRVDRSTAVGAATVTLYFDHFHILNYQEAVIAKLSS